MNGLNAAQIILCNAPGSNVTNTRINGSNSIYNDGFEMYYSNGTNITNVSSSYNAFGFNIVSSYKGSFTNNIANNNNGTIPFSSALNVGFAINGESNSFQNNTANNNAGQGFWLVSSIVPSGFQNTTLKSNTANGNGGIGFEIDSDSNLVQNNTANNNFGAGFSVMGGNFNNLSNNAAINNTDGIDVIFIGCDEGGQRP